MGRLNTSSNILMELRKICQHPYLSEPEMEDRTVSEEEQHRRLVDGSGKFKFLKLLLPELKARGFRILLFSQFKIALDRIEDFLYGEGYNYLRLDGDVAQVNRQKDMDRFNAPDSDYFIFLLTTRAGGVGINLASADAVIMFDPDFNPHQDLQAIARSHRYGQKKRVLVFRLMAENSVESRIINSGKRKMVLDHLVVQQMGKETEEGEVDNLILYGAEEIAKSNPDDMSHDRVWTKELVNELIDGAEKEAEEQAKEMARREAAEAAGEVGEGENAKAGFSFARVWETKTHQFNKEDEATGDNEPEPFADDATWAKFLDEAEKERNGGNGEITFIEGGRKRKARKLLSYDERRLLAAVALSDEEDEDSQTAKKGKGKGKGKGKMTDGDDDFQMTGGDDSDSDADVFFDAVPENLDLTNADDGPRGLAPPKLTKAERKALQRRHQAALQQAAADGSAAAATAGPSTAAVPVASSSTSEAGVIVPHSTTTPSTAPGLPSPSIRAASTVRAPPTAVAGPGPSSSSQHVGHTVPGSLTHDPSMSILSGGPMFRPTNPGMLVPAATPSAIMPRPAPQLHAGAIHAAKVASAREVLMNLRGAINTINNLDMRHQWYGVVNTGLPTTERKRMYLGIAIAIDDLLSQQGIRNYYTHPGNLDVVNYYIGLPTHNLTTPHAPMPGSSQHNPPTAPMAQVFPQPQGAFQPTPQQQQAQQFLLQAVQQQQFQQQQAQQQLAQRIQQQVPQYGQQQQMPQHVQHHVQQQHGLLPNAGRPQQGHVASNVSHGQQPGPTAPAQPSRPQQNGHVDNQPPVSSATAPASNNVPVSTTRPSTSGQREPQSTTRPQQLAQPTQPQPTVQATSVRPQASLPSSSGTSGQAGTSSLAGLAAPRTAIHLSTTSTPAPAAVAQGAGNSLQMGDSSRIGPPAPPLPNASTDQCYWCRGDHLLRDCPGLISRRDLSKFEQEISALPDGEDKIQGLNAIRHMRIAHDQNDYAARAKKNKRGRKSNGEPDAGGGSAPTGSDSGNDHSRGEPNGTDSKPTDGGSPAPRPSAAANGVANAAAGSSKANGVSIAPRRTASTGQTADEAIPIDSDNDTPRPTKKQRTSKSHSAERQKAPPEVNTGGNTTPPGCLICLSPSFHVARKCPIVEAGPASIEEAMKRFSPEDSLWSILSMIHRALLTGTVPSRLPKCPFCGGSCGQTVRECAETRGSRKQLKAKIRQLEGPLRMNEAKVKELKARREEQQKAGVYSAADHANMSNLTSDINKIERELEEVTRPALAPLYEAYLSWPNPGNGQ